MPPAHNLSSLIKQGFDLVGFSGGKSLRGPQSSGLLLGRADLIEAAYMNNNPFADTIGRPCKVGKEEIMGLLAAVEVFVKRDHEADQKLWNGFMQSIARDLQGIRTVKAEVYVPAYPWGSPCSLPANYVGPRRAPAVVRRMREETAGRRTQHRGECCRQ